MYTLYNIYRRAIAVAVALTVMLFCSCSKKQWHTYEGAVWGTTFHITYLSEANMDDSINAVMRMVELSLSPFDKQSVVSRINRGETVECDSLFIAVFERGKEVWSLSGGAFDPTVAPAVNLWGFGYKNLGREPFDSEIDSVRELVGFGKACMNDGMLLSPHGMEYDFSAITKGFGCDMVGRMLARNGSIDYMVEIGGEIALSGKNRMGEDWHIMVDAPVESNTEIVHDKMAVIAVTGCGIATSGNYRNYRETEKGKIWHTIDPRTCRPAENVTISATVIAPDAMTADALATACMVMHPDSAIAMIDRLEGVRALLVVRSQGAESEWNTIASGDFPERR
ncbi:MAG: FAD:protein FMN transferase [Paramuribaculum sp.]|nr:FAD:protein FMN transferase [Paramuribaculum sp.]